MVRPHNADYCGLWQEPSAGAIQTQSGRNPTFISRFTMRNMIGYELKMPDTSPLSQINSTRNWLSDINEVTSFHEDNVGHGTLFMAGENDEGGDVNGRGDIDSNVSSRRGLSVERAAVGHWTRIRGRSRFQRRCLSGQSTTKELDDTWEEEELDDAVVEFAGRVDPSTPRRAKKVSMARLSSVKKDEKLAQATKCVGSGGPSEEGAAKGEGDVRDRGGRHETKTQLDSQRGRSERKKMTKEELDEMLEDYMGNSL